MMAEMWKHIVRIGVMLDIVGVTCKVGQTHAFVLVPSGHVSQKMQSITGRNIPAFAKQTYTPKVCVCCLYLLVCELIFQLGRYELIIRFSSPSVRVLGPVLIFFLFYM